MKPGNSHTLTIGGVDVPLRLRVNRQARRISLKVDPYEGDVVVTVPHARFAGDGLAFAGERSAWLAERLAEVPERVPFAAGAIIPFLGEAHRIRHCPEARSGVSRFDGEIRVSGASDFLPRRVGDWLRVQARREFSARAQPLSEQVDRRVRRITVRDTRSRWGSCSSDGALSFCWRLILAPAPVLGYVAAHEIAHLVHRDHGKNFWSLVGDLCPDFQARRNWLKRHGSELHRYG